MSVSSSFGNDLTTEILSELVLSGSPVLNEIDLHDKTHKLGLIKRITSSAQVKLGTCQVMLGTCHIKL